MGPQHAESKHNNGKQNKRENVVEKVAQETGMEGWPFSWRKTLHSTQNSSFQSLEEEPELRPNTWFKEQDWLAWLALNDPKEKLDGIFS